MRMVLLIIGVLFLVFVVPAILIWFGALIDWICEKF